jgi:hypothetical protein
MFTLVSALALCTGAAEAASAPTSEKEKAQVIDGLMRQLRELYVESGADRKTIETGIRARAKRRWRPSAQRPEPTGITSA